MGPITLLERMKLALLSVSDKRGLAEFAASLVRDHGYEILSTGGTARALLETGIAVTEVGRHTGFPEIMEGRVKTLHPKIHGGLLCRRGKPEDLAEAERNGIRLIDLVAVNLYPFEETVARPGVELAEAIENIDIGGPSMLRSAAKNHESVTVVCDPSDYAEVLSALGGEPGALAALRRRLALKVFQRTAAYDAAIARYLESQAAGPDLEALAGYPARLSLSWTRAQTLRYGENPHQKGALYGTFHDHYQQLQGKELSYNNVLDITAATYLIGEFERPTVAILKHTNPCGLASAETLADAWEGAYATDRQAPFGGIVIANRTVDGALAALVADIFTEVIIAPRFGADALAILGKKKNLRLMVAKEGIGADALQEDRVEFLVSPNVGEEPRALEKVASGGEISRIALALKTCLAGPKTSVVRTLVFDEVDAGVGGSAAEGVGRRLKQLAAASQVLCVTHLPQIASFADHHYRVEKQESNGRTMAVVEELDGPARTREVGRMLSEIGRASGR